jgi:hypothetical protein
MCAWRRDTEHARTAHHPRWNSHSQIIYWWTTSDADPEHVYRVAYNGYVLVVPKKMSMGSCAFRAVRQAPPKQRVSGQ